MLLNLKLSLARAISHLAKIEAKILGNMVLAKKDFLVRFKVAGDQWRKYYLHTTSMSHSALFAGQVTYVAKELEELKRRRPVPTAGGRWHPPLQPQRDHALQARAQPAKPRSSHQPLQASSTQVTPRKCGGWPAPQGPAKEAGNRSKKHLTVKGEALL